MIKSEQIYFAKRTLITDNFKSEELTVLREVRLV